MRNITILDVNYGKTKNWLEFTCYAGFLNPNFKYKFSYCITELDVGGLSLTDNQMESLRFEINKRINVKLPFELNKIREIFKNNRNIEICDK